MGRLAFAFVLTLCAAPLAAQGESVPEFSTLKGHGGPIMAIAVSPEGQLATGSFDNSVGLWEDGVPSWLEGHEAAVTALTYGPGGTLVSGGDDFAVRVWGETPRVLGHHQGKVAALAVSPDGQTLASGSWDGTIRLWPLTGGEGSALPAPGAGVNALAFGPDGTLYAGTMSGALLRYAQEGGAPVPMVQHGFGINRITLGPDWIAYGAVDGGTRVLDLETGAQIADLTLERRPILSMAHHPATHQLAVGDGEGFIMIVDTQSWQITRDFRATRQGPVWALAFSTDGTVIHAGGLDDVAYAWPVEMLDAFEPGISGARSFLRDAETMPNGERQFMRKCSICHATTPGPSRKAGPTLHGVFGRPAGTVPGYIYSDTLNGAGIIWDETTIDALFDQGPDHYIPGSKMPMQVIAGSDDRADLIDYLKRATTEQPTKGK
ncbi:cytochrome C (plasmid) [Salipiger sp. CCB-MM3]|uniref:c-type cytochrome n=1 Tax=Salipiger sp. CCB-MM3 TaxID=1792508 RepID=UPI00080A9A42|nr:c-type cytochrome [Salipiger sp. CCB-MM3]ANT63307.1 cytochrome C [Salipiger sp. CCB-MM3]